MSALLHRVTVGMLGAGFVVCHIVYAATGPGATQSGRLEVVKEFALSPNGSDLAEVVRPLGSGAGTAEIVVRSLGDGHERPRTIYAGGVGISNLQWVNDSRIVFVRSGEISQVVSDNFETGRRRVLFQRKGGISNIVYNRKSDSFAYEYTKVWSWRNRVSVRMKPGMDVMQLTEPKWARPYKTYIGVHELGTDAEGGQARNSNVAKLREVYAGIPPVLTWRGRQLLAIKPMAGSFGTRIVDVTSGKTIDGRAPLFRELGMAISPSGRLAVTAMRLWRHKRKMICGCSGNIYIDVLGANGRVHEISVLAAHERVWEISALWWAGRNRLIAQVLGTRGTRADDFDGPLRWRLVELDWRTDRIVKRFEWSAGDLGDGKSTCSIDAMRTKAVCEAQTLTRPPELVEIDLRTGKMRELGEVNPAWRPLDFRFVKIKVPSAYGSASTGFLALPADAKRRPVPLAVMLYGFDEQYSRHAQWITSYPVARLVHAGIAVLLVNWPYVPGLRTNYESELRAKHAAVATIANALPAVRAAGIKVSRAMVMGWSFGGMFVSYAIQGLHEYVAAQVGDPAAYNTTEYDLAGDSWDNLSDIWFGGPPIAKYMDHYLRFDPAADGRPANGPILLEFVSRNPDAGQYLEEWRAVGTDVQAFAYRRSVHWLSVPAEAAIGKLRDLYWAKMNLFGPESVTCAQLRSVGLTVPRDGWWNQHVSGPRANGPERERTCRRSDSGFH